MPHARTSAEPDDGLSTRQRRLRPVLVVNTGEGKGKTTAAMGTALRAWHQGWRVGVFQFVKSGRWHVGEEDALRALGQLHEEIGVGGPVTWEVMGTGWSWTRSFDAAENPEAAAREGSSLWTRPSWTPPMSPSPLLEAIWTTSSSCAP